MDQLKIKNDSLINMNICEPQAGGEAIPSLRLISLRRMNSSLMEVVFLRELIPQDSLLKANSKTDPSCQSKLYIEAHGRGRYGLLPFREADRARQLFRRR